MRTPIKNTREIMKGLSGKALETALVQWPDADRDCLGLQWPDVDSEDHIRASAITWRNCYWFYMSNITAIKVNSE